MKYIRGLKRFPCEHCKVNLVQRVGIWYCDNNRCTKGYSLSYTRKELDLRGKEKEK